MGTQESIRKILIIQPSFIGDVILATSLVEKLASFYPSARIDFMLRKGNEALLLNNPHVTRVFVWDKKKQKNRNLFRIIGQARREQYDLVINLHRFFSGGLVTVLSGAKTTAGYDKNPFSRFFSIVKKHQLDLNSQNPHETERYHALIEHITDLVPGRPKLYPSSQDYSTVEAYKKTPYICIAPSSVWFTKQYPKERWVELINAIPASYNIYLLGGPADKGLTSWIAGQTSRDAITDLSGRLSFLESAALMKDAAMNYVNDSGPLHIASAMNARVCAVFCSTTATMGFGPLSEHSTVVEAEPKPVCKPCGLHGHRKCPEGHFKCALEISQAKLLEALEK